MYDRFADRAKKVMELAGEEAQRFNHEYIGTEHILLGLVEEGSGVGANVLKNLDVDLRKVRLEVEKLVKSGPDMVTVRNLPHSPRAKRVIEHAIEEARYLDHNYVGTEHLLLGLLCEQEGVAALVLMNMGVKVEKVREEIVHLLGGELKLRDEVSTPKQPNETERRPADTSSAIGRLVAILTRMPNADAKIRRLVIAMESWLHQYAAEVEDLLRMKDDAVRKADYERAAQLRDRANGLAHQIDEAFDRVVACIESLSSPS